jgi:hypothetical protein
VFSVLVLLAAALRVVVLLGYPPAMFFNDSYNYMTDAATGVPDVVRANGYPFFLRLLLPAHNLSVVTGLQALMGLAMGVTIYALLRRRGLPWWGGCVLALPVLFDVWELQLEHMVAADTLFITLVVAAIVLMCWWDRPPVWAIALAGLLTGYAATVRSVGEPMLVLLVIAVLARKMGWRRIVAVIAAGVVPIVGYMAWFHSSYGSFALDRASGTFLYSRVSSFADCAKIDPSPSLRVLCDPRPPGQRESSQEYLWANDTPLGELTGTNNIYRFTPHIEYLTSRFAEHAIIAQPLDYVAVVADDTWRTFGWTRFRSDLAGSGDKFRFEDTTEPVPGWVPGDKANRQAAEAFGGASLGKPAVVRPWSFLLEDYEKQAFLRGPFLLALLLIGLWGVIMGVRRRSRARPEWGIGGLGLLPWLVGAALVILPPMTAGFSYRYSLAAVPAICLAAGLAFAGRGRLRLPGRPGPAPATETGATETGATETGAEAMISEGRVAEGRVAEAKVAVDVPEGSRPPASPAAGSTGPRPAAE